MNECCGLYAISQLYIVKYKIYNYSFDIFFSI